jgi:putative Holliday junction resolvase
VSAGERLLGLDVGGKRIGVAVSDELGLIASPVGMVRRDANAGREIREYAERFGATRLIVGLPVGMSGREGPQALEVRDFVQLVAPTIGLPYEYWDERLTTSIAEKSPIARGTRREKRKDQVDAVAAAIILQGYLDNQRWKAGSGRGR